MADDIDSNVECGGRTWWWNHMAGLTWLAAGRCGSNYESVITHWGRVMHICISKPTIIASDNGLSPGRCQAIIRTNAGILLIWPLGTNFSEILIPIHSFSFKKMHLKMSSGKWRPFCLSLNVLIKLLLRIDILSTTCEIDPSHKSHNALVSHNALFYNRNVHICAHFCYKMVHCGIWNRYIVGFVR